MVSIQRATAGIITKNLNNKKGIQIFFRKRLDRIARIEGPEQTSLSGAV